MATPGSKGTNNKRAATELRLLRSRLTAAEDTLDAIRSGQIDAVMVTTPVGDELFTIGRADNGYRVFVEAMHDGAVTVASDGTILYCNRCFANIVRLPLEKVIGSSVYDLVPESARQTFDGAFQAAREGARRAELVLSAGDGTQVPVFLSLANFQEYGSQAICMVVTDLTEQKRQEEIVAAGRLAQVILEQSVEAVAVCNSTGQVVLATAALHKLCGCNPILQQFDSVAPLDLCQPGSDIAIGRFSAQDVIHGARYHGAEVCYCGQDGDPRHLLLSAAPTPLPNEEAAGCVVSLFDIEERRRGEDALRRSERLAATGRLAATIAHEINNPLEAITNLLYLINISPNLAADLRPFAATAQTELARVAHITKQTLTFHRTSNAPQPVHVRDLIESVVYLHSRNMLEKQIQLSTECNFDGEIFGYPNELRQVISNLVENAIEACSAGGRLRLRAYRSAEFCNSHKPGVRLVIADNGPGVHPDHQGRLFEPFFTTKGEKGTGLGLWVSRGIIAKHGGFIRMRSRSQGSYTGTVFSIFLPVSHTEHLEQAAS